MIEEWKDINGYEELYQVSNYGNVRRIKYDTNYRKTPKIKNLTKTINNGYFAVSLFLQQNKKTVKVHRLVAQAFIDNPDNLPEVNHKDENKLNNNVDNLEWCTRKYNNNYGTRNKKMAISNSKKVNQYDLNGNFIKTWNSISEANLYLGLGHHIGECCTGKRKTMGGYIWKFCNERSDE